MNVKTNDYYETHMGYCNECNKLTTIMGPIWGIAMNLKNQPLLRILYASIAMYV
jgi:hypothetical protein